MGKVLDKIKILVNDMESDWEEPLREINIWDDVQDIFYKHPEHRKANTILALLVLAYDKDSEWLDMHLDRMEAKGRILQSLAGPSYGTDPDYINACTGIMSPYHQVTDWFLDYQMDRRWKDIISGYEYHSKATSMSRMAFSVKDMVDIGKMLREARLRKEESDTLLKTLQDECVRIDTALEKEGRPKLTGRSREGAMVPHEMWIKGLESDKKEEGKPARKKKAGKSSDDDDDEGWDDFEEDDDDGPF